MDCEYPLNLIFRTKRGDIDETGKGKKSAYAKEENSMYVSDRYLRIFYRDWLWYGEEHWSYVKI